jgi:hypothetical protein
MGDKAATLTIDEILSMVSEIARDTEAGADRFRALKMLASAGSASVVLPEPLDDNEMVDRIARIMKSSGKDIVKRAWTHAFHQQSSDAMLESPRLHANDIPAFLRARAMSVKSLKKLYPEFPEVKRPGFPPGYPAGKGISVQTAWCQDMSLKILLERENQRLKNVAEAEKNTPAPVAWEGPEDRYGTMQSDPDEKSEIDSE